MSKHVTIYTTPTCGYCRLAKQFFKENNIEYTEYNIRADRARAQEMIKKSGQMGVPVIVVPMPNEPTGEQVMIGFGNTALKEMLDIQ